MRRVLAGLGALILSAVLLAGPPALLILLAGNPIPSWDRLLQAFTMPDYGGEFMIGTVIPVIAWAAWATFAIGYLAEIPNQLRRSRGHAGRRVRVPGLGLQQKAAGVLIATIISVFAPATAFAAPADTAAPVDVTAVSIAAPLAATHASSAQASAAAQESAGEDEIAAPTYTVQRGDSLWAIAEATLGDGARWPEIYELNHDQSQPGGYTVGQRDGIDPGMVLTIPGEAAAHTAAAAADVVEHERTVVRGDTLWDIAEEELGSGARYPEIFHASQNIVQPDGRQLTDPNLILPGWTVQIPGVTPAPVTAPVPPVAPSAGGTDADTSTGAATTGDDRVDGAAAGADEDATSGLGFVTGKQGAASTADADSSTVDAAARAQSADDVDDPAEWVDIVTDWRTIGGVGFVLAAGLLAFLGLRRRQQRRNRKPGKRIAMPTDEVNAVELELRAVENPRGMDAVDHALRLLAIWAQDSGAKLPALYALRLAEDEISVFLDEPAHLPAPFTPVSTDDMAWSIKLDELTPLERIPSAPYPALVTLGHDENDAHLLVDLERMGALNVQGSEDMEAATLTAIALELATTPWAENLQVTLVGIAPELPQALGASRIRYVEDIPTLVRNLRGQAKAVTEALEAEGVSSLEEARTASADAESWTPEIVVLGTMPHEPERSELAELVSRIPRVGIAAIAAGHLAGGWNYAVRDKDAAELEIPDADGAVLPLTPQIVSREDYEKILALFTVAGDDEGIAHSPASEEVPLDAIAEAQVLTDPSAGAAEPDTTAPAEAEVGEDLDVDEPAIANVDEEPAEPPAATDDAPAEPMAPLIDLWTPRVQLLGPVTVLSPQGATPTGETMIKQWASQVLRATELVAFLATHPASTTEQVHDALWPGSDPAKGTQSRNGLTTKTRRWLGQDAEGNPYLPPAQKGIYELNPVVRSDWGDWKEIVGEDPTAATTDSLVRALNMVKGQPISGVKEKYYVWAETLRQEMIAAIGDAAHELATRAILNGDTRNARMAAAIGRQVDPINEVYWRDGLRAEHMAGDHAGVDRLIIQLEHTLAQVDPDYAEPEPETEALIADIRNRRRRAS